MRKKVVGFALSAMLSVLCVFAERQQARKVTHIGFLSGGYQAGGYLLEPLSHALRQLGYADLKDFVVEMRSGGDDTVLVKNASELVHLKVDVIVTDTTAAALAAKSAT